ncbi:MAG: glycosyltransferase family 4 protein [Acidobacteriota bacterium]
MIEGHPQGEGSGGGPGKVLFISPQPFFEWRGSPIRVSYTLRALAELGHEVDFLTLPIGQEKQIEGIRIFRVPNWFGIEGVPIGPSFWKAVFDVFLLFKALRLARRRRYDVVHGVEEAGALALIVARMTGGSVVFEKHSDPSSYRRGPFRNLVLWLYAKVEAFSIRRAEAVIATGPGLVRQAEQALRRRRSSGDGWRQRIHHISDIPSSLVEADPERTAAIRKRLCSRARQKLVLYVGSFAVYQGVHLLFASIPLVARRREDINFVVIGGSGQQIEEEKAKLARAGAAEAVLFVGKVPPDELPDYLAAADILLSPRIAGSNTPLKLLDYLKAGRAIVATNSEANRLILDQATALLVDLTPEALAAAVCRLVDDDGLRRRLAAQGRRLIDERYNFDEFRGRLAACYEGLRNGKGLPEAR